MDVQWRPWRADALLRALADVLTPAGEVIIETYGSHLPARPRQSRSTNLARCITATTSSTGAFPPRDCAGLLGSPG